HLLLFFLLILHPSRSTLSLHDALPIYLADLVGINRRHGDGVLDGAADLPLIRFHPIRLYPEIAAFQRIARRFYVASPDHGLHVRSEEHTSELQSRSDLVCRLLLEKKNQ